MATTKMKVLFTDGDWGIVNNKEWDGASMCLRHMSCGDEIHAGQRIPGRCACREACVGCQCKPPDEIKGLLLLAKWKR